jgi:protein SCO1
MRRTLRIVAIASALLCAACPSACADGDPASDYLLSRQVFVLLGSSGVPPAQRRLSDVVGAANKAGFSIRVAVISSEYDLGSVSVLWKKPRTYARFLGIELSLSYKGLLLVVMPNGFGVNWPGHSTAAAYGALGNVEISPGEAGTLNAAQAAVRALASAGGVNLTHRSTKAAAHARSASTAALTARKSGSGIGAAAVLLILAAAALLVALGANLVLLLRGREGALRFNWALTGLAALLAILVAAPILTMLTLLQGRSDTPKAVTDAGVQALTQETPTPFPEGQRPAPNFTLTDQSGQRISPAAYRGRPVIITFIDPLCRNYCPLEAKVLNDADERLPASERPQIIAVSVDVYADTHADLMLDFRRWSLVPQWRWAIGTPAQLAAVWRRYYAEVEVQTKHIAGTTVHYITHSEMAYIVDRKGFERALFSWPFSAKAVQKELLKVEHA